MAAGGLGNTILITLAHKVEGLASFSSAVDKVLQAQRDLSRRNHDYTTELGVLHARLQDGSVALNQLRTAYSKAGVSVNTYSTMLAQAQSRLARLNATFGSEATVLNRITALEKKRDAAVKAGASGQTLGGYNSIISQLQKVADQYSGLPTKINTLDNALEKSQSRFERLGSRIQVAIANMSQLGRDLGLMSQKQASAGQMAPGSITSALTNISGAFQKITEIGGKTTQVIGGATSSILNLTGAGAILRGAWSAVGKTFEFVGGIIQYAIGDLLAGAVRSGIQLVSDLGQKALETVRDFERLSLSLRAMTAKELQAADATLSIGAALKAAGPIANATLEWLERLAVLSPFSLDDIKQAYLFGQAMGFTTQQAARVTQAVVDWASATGRSGDQIERVIYALGQMRSAGRLVGQDILQLAQAGISVDQILAKAFGKTTAEILKMRTDGLIPANEAIQIIISSLEKDWAGAAAGQARSISGLLNSFQDLSNFLVRDLLGPIDALSGKVGGVFGVLSQHLGDLVDFLSSGGVRQAVKNWGLQLGQMAANAYTWGQNLIKSFTNGMISAIVDVIMALSRIGQIITSYLMAHSPPKLLPDIDKWGRSALQAYLEGFSDVRGESFDTLESKMESFLRSLSVDVMPELNLVPMILQIREALGKALSGDISVTDIVSSLGLAGTSMAGYVSALFNLEAANKAVADAQKNLDSVTSKYDKLLGDIEAKLQRINNAQSDLSDEQRKRMLGLIELDPNATLAEKQMARLEIEKLSTEKTLRDTKLEADAATTVAKAGVDEAQKKQDMAEEAFKIQQRLIDSQIHTNELIQEQVALLERLAKAAKEAAGGGTDLGVPGEGLAGLDITNLGKVGNKGQKPGPGMFDEIIAALNHLKVIWSATWDQITAKFQPVKDAIGRVVTSWNALVAAIKLHSAATQVIFGEFVAKLIELVATKGAEFIDILAVALTFLGEVWKKYGPDIMKFTADLVLGIIDLGLTIGIWVTQAIVGLALFAVAVYTGLAAIYVTVTGWIETVKTFWSDFFTLVGVYAQVFLNYLLAYWTQKFDDIKRALSTFVQVAVLKFIEFKYLAIEKFGAIVQWIKDHWSEIKTEIQDRLTEAKDKVIELAGNIYDGITGKIGEILTYLTDPATLQGFIDAGSNFVQGIIDGITSAAGALATAIRNMVSGMFGTAQTEGEQHSPSRRAAREIGKPLAQGVALGLLQGMGTVDAAMSKLVSSVIQPPSRSGQYGSNSTVYNDTRNMTYSPTYNTNAPPPQLDMAIAEVWSR